MVLIIDVTRFEQQLMLCEPILEMGIPTLLVLNMTDELERRGGSIDADVVADQLGWRSCAPPYARAREWSACARSCTRWPTAGPLPDRPCPAVSNVPQRAGGVQLPMLDVFAARRRSGEGGAP